MTEFTLKLTQREDGSLYVLLQNDGYQSAIDTEKLNGETQHDRFVICNLFRNLEQMFTERCFPEIALKWERRTLPTGETVQLVPQ